MQPRLLSGAREGCPWGEDGAARRRIVITGAAGFIGAHLTERLMRRAPSVLVLDNLVSGRREHVSEHTRFEYIDLGTSDENRIISLVRDFGQIH